jgi:hypothetical protein
LLNIEGVPPKVSISTQQQNGVQLEERPRSTNNIDKYSLRQNLVHEPDPELRRILHLFKLQQRPMRILGFMDQKSISSFSTGRAGLPSHP